MGILDKLFNRKALIPNRNFYYSGITPPDRTQEGFLYGYQSIGWLHAVVFRIALGCSEVEWTLFDTTNQDKPKQIFKHPVLTLLRQVNPFQTSNEFIALDTIYNELIGESFWALNLNALGEPAEIILPYPHKMSVVPDKSFPFVKGYVYGAGADAIPFDVNEIIHFKYPNPLNQYHGLAPARAIGINLDAEQNADKWVNQFFYNSARPDGVIQFDYNLSDEQFDKLKKQWSEKYKGVSKAHQVALLEGGGKYIQIQNSIKDMDFPNLKQKNRDVILGVFGMPQSVMGISENVNKANAEAGDYTFARWIVKPRLDWKKAKIQEQLIPKFRRSENLEIGFKEVVPETTEQKITSAESGMRAGYLTINEARKMQGYDSLPNGDVLLVPLNLIPTPVSGKLSASAPPPASEEEMPKSKGGEGSGNFGHEGRPGEVGGSGEGGGGESNEGANSNDLSRAGMSPNPKRHDSKPNSVGVITSTHDDYKGREMYTIGRGDFESLPYPVDYQKGDAVGVWRGDGQPLQIGRISGTGESEGRFRAEVTHFSGSFSEVEKGSSLIARVSSLKITPASYYFPSNMVGASGKSKSLSPDQKKLHWEAYAKKTERQEGVFNRVLEKVFNEQKDLVIEELERTGKLPPILNDEQTAKKFEPAIELVYHSAFEDAV